MATFTKRVNRRWHVVVEGHAALRRVFRDKAAAEGYAAQLKQDPPAAVGASIKMRIDAVESTSWQVRIRCTDAPVLTKSFSRKADAEQWAKEREGEIVRRQFVDHREADRHSLGDLLQRYDDTRLAAKPVDDPDRARIRKLRRHPLCLIRVSVLQPSDIARFRDERVRHVKGATVRKELELISRVIGVARAEWGIHLAHNPASGVLVKRPKPEPGDARSRRLATVAAPLVTAAPRRSTRRKNPADDLEFDPGVSWLLAMPVSEQQALLRAARYPHWFTLRKRDVGKATRRAREQRAAAATPVKARVREPRRIWAVISFAIETAMRRGEIAKLEWSHVDLEGGFLHLPGSITKNRKERIVPLTRRARRILMTQPRASNLVFDSNANALKLAWQRVRERVAVRDLRFHDLRHEGTSRLFENTTLREVEIGHITGHTDPRMLQRYYNLRAREFVQRFHASFR
jgi:integrase